jgi:acyl-CoA oxidase
MLGISSALGVYDGRVYEALWDRAQTEPLNEMEVPAAYEVCMVQLGIDINRLISHTQESIRPMLLRGRQQANRKNGAKL